MKRHLFSALGVVMVLSFALGACASPTPATIVQTVQVQVTVPPVQVTSQVEVTRIVAGTPQTVEVTAPPPTAQPSKYAGVTVNILTFTGPQIAEPLQRRAPDFEKLTGAH